MNIWTQKSIELANQRNYLDLLYKIYPMSNNLRREMKEEDIQKLNEYYEMRDKYKLLNLLLKQEVFPIKDSYISYLKRDKSAINRNPATVDRIVGILYEMGINKIIDRTTAPKETNRQIGPLFKNQIDRGTIGCAVTKNENEFLEYDGNIIFNSSDRAMQTFAKNHLGYLREKGLDFIGKFNNTYVIGEAKFLTDFGGHQNAQYEDAMATLDTSLLKTDKKVLKIAILDGVLYISSQNKMHSSLFSKDGIIISAILLREFLYSIQIIKGGKYGINIQKQKKGKRDIRNNK